MQTDPWYVFISASEATAWLGLATSIGIPFLVSWIKRITWPDWSKWLVTIVVSAVLGYLTLISTGAVVNGMGFAVLVTVLITASTTWYQTWFKALGFEKWLNPPEAIVAEAATRAGNITERAVKSAVDEAVEDTKHN